MITWSGAEAAQWLCLLFTDCTFMLKNRNSLIVNLVASVLTSTSKQLHHCHLHLTYTHEPVKCPRVLLRKRPRRQAGALDKNVNKIVVIFCDIRH